LKAGATYVPLDETQPVERRDAILSETVAKVLLIDSENMSNIGNFQFGVFVMDLQMEHLQETIERSSVVSADQNAYIIYTSGSTGKPKGVLVPHRGMTNTILWRREYYGFNESDVAMQLFAPVFDGSVTDIFTTLVSGGTLVVTPDNRKSDVMWLAQLIPKYHVTNFIAVPSLYKVLLDELNNGNAGTLKSVTLAGEDVDRSLVLQHYKTMPWVKLFNEYGPTEKSVCSTAGFLAPDEEVTMGRAITNVHTYVLDNHLRVVPPGGVGELCLAGSGLANGYLDQPGFTGEKFIRNPVNLQQLIYRTGDYVRHLSFGKLKFLSRADNQIKYRGYRVELGEIELTLKIHPNIKDAVVDMHTNGLSEGVLTGFVIVDKPMTEDELRGYLLAKLPVYMTPDQFVFLHDFPVGPTGKTDRRKLKSFDLTMQASNTPYVEPVTEMEAALVGIWREVLGHEKIGITDNFFFLGGHSLKATQITSRILKSLNAEIDVQTVFNNPTIESLARVVEAAARIVDESAQPVNY
jgi:bacitracin synthase 3